MNTTFLRLNEQCLMAVIVEEFNYPLFKNSKTSERRPLTRLFVQRRASGRFKFGILEMLPYYCGTIFSFRACQDANK